jgi:hypothetical protein
MSTGLATRMSLLALGVGFALSLAPMTPAAADEDPVVRQPRVRVSAPRPAPRVRTVVWSRTIERVRYVPVYYTTTCGGCATPAPQPVVYRPAYYNTTCGTCALVAAEPVYYAARYYAAGCGSCGQAVALPYYWAARYARVRHAYDHY